MDINSKKERSQQTFTRLAMILFFIEWIRGAVLIAFLPTYILTSWGLTTSVVGIAVSVHYLTDSLIKSYIGYLLDRYPGRTVLHGGFFLGFIGLLVMVTTHSPWMLIVASACLGAGFSPIWILCMSQVSEEKRAQQMGTLYVYWMAGLGPVMMNMLIGGGLSLSIAVIGIFFVAGWIMVGLVKMNKVSVQSVKISVGEQFVSLWNKVKKGGFLVPGMLLQTTAGGILVPFLTSFAISHLGLSHSQLSIVLFMGGAGVVLFLVPMGKWFDQVGGKWFLVVGFGVFAVALFGLTSINSFSAAIGLSLLLGCAYAALLPSWNALMAGYIPEDSVGISWGLLFSIEGLGVVIGPLIGGWLGSSGNQLLPFQVSACLFGVISVVYLLSPARLFIHRNRVTEKL